ncbi:hypothetical protein ANABIO32_44660 [Rossellomorea marisflavi]|nr:hypothetical protein ANABIO32_44660 [Rossellomorea marisflavi]
MVTKAGKKGSRKAIPYNVMATAAYKSLIKKGVTISFDIVEDTPKQLLSSKTGHQALTLNRVSKRLEENLIQTKNVLNSDAVKNVMEKTYQSVVRSAISKVARSEVFNGVRKLVMNENGHVKFSFNRKTRLPRTNGKWDGEPGNGKWYSEKPEVKRVTMGKGVEFLDGRPNFTPWSKGSIKFKEGMLDGTKVDFKLVYAKIMKIKGFNSQNQAKVWLKEKGLTPHHKSATEIELIPTDLHANVPHIGSASDLRGGNFNE